MLRIHDRFVTACDMPVANNGIVRLVQLAARASSAELELCDRVRQAIKATVCRAFRIRTPLYFQFSDLFSVGDGGSMGAHADNCFWDPDSHRWKRNEFSYRKFSAVLYLNSSGTDFEGGNLEFIRQSNLPSKGLEIKQVVVPTAGRLVVFGSGSRNLHRVAEVLRGRRCVLSAWFTTQRRFAEPNSCVTLARLIRGGNALPQSKRELARTLDMGGREAHRWYSAVAGLRSLQTRTAARCKPRGGSICMSEPSS
jgi:predicted 2-oxoglutarate/Fe(II)-dependent dioxygenase YbiX